MTATMPISRRTTHHAHTGLRTWWETIQLRHSRRALDAYFERARLARPVTDPNRHAWESPALEDAFVRLAAANPQAVTPTDDGPAALDAEREQLLLAVCDAWFHETYPAPEHRWTPDVIAAYQRLIDDVRACFHPGGGA